MICNSFHHHGALAACHLIRERAAKHAPRNNTTYISPSDNAALYDLNDVCTSFTCRQPLSETTFRRAAAAAASVAIQL